MPMINTKSELYIGYGEGVGVGMADITNDPELEAALFTPGRRVSRDEFITEVVNSFKRNNWIGIWDMSGLGDDVVNIGFLTMEDWIDLMQEYLNRDAVWVFNEDDSYWE